MRKIISLLVGLSVAAIYAQVNPLIGIKDEKHTVYAFTDATLHINSNTVISNATLLIRDEKIVDYGAGIGIPNGAKTIRCTGKHIYASFIELWSDYGLVKKEKEETGGAYYWNNSMKSEYVAYSNYNHDKSGSERWRKFGFGAVVSHRQDGILRGSGVLVTLADIESSKNILIENAALFGSLDRGSSTNDYPTSLVGTIALIRQFLYDSKWYAEMSGKADKNFSLDNFNKLKTIPIIFKVTNRSDILRLEKIAREFGLNFQYMGNGDEFDRIQQLKTITSTVIVPIQFPKPYILTDPMDADLVSLEDLYRWDIAPANLQLLDSNGIKYLISASANESPADFFKNLRKSIQYGLKKEKALYALTEGPAKFMKADALLGTLDKNKLANFIITEGELGSEEFAILENWVQGKQYIIDRAADALDLRGTYAVQTSYSMINGKTIEVKGKPGRLGGTLIMNDSTKLDMNLSFEKYFVSASFYSSELKSTIRISGMIDQNDKSWKGIIENQLGERFDFTTSFTPPVKKEDLKKDKVTIAYSNLRFPNKSYGWNPVDLKNAEGKSYLIKNTTVWTNEKEGILTGYDVITENGKIKSIGKGLSCSSCITIDGTGMHLTSGIIDEHSHIAITRGVNEAGQSSSAEVRMSDAVNADDINIYRQLSGGVTMSQLLHGSANPIGGQSALIKLRWGKSEEELLYKDAPGFIKFALGENVKQSNWGERNVTRYPQTRMGVEQFFYEMFYRAKEYAKKKNSKEIYRKDLELETLCEILDGKRFITCHSYVQSEINMLLEVADSLGFKVNTFTHILEGYKVADKMKAHGANASTFADWWAYKFEVYEAIPYNSAILTRVGVNTCVNSDDAEMARRLNHEAAKSIKYGGLTEEEAWKLCTLNPAIMLHVDDKVGSIKVGKDADLVLWSANPLSIYSMVKFTMIDGIIYYSDDRNTELMKLDASEKNRLIQKMMQAVKDGEEGVSLSRRQYLRFECETLENFDYELLQIVD